MSVQQDATDLLGLLTQEIDVSSAFLALFKFIDESPNGRFGWLRLGSEAVNGVECDALIATWHEKLRQSISEGLEVSWLLGIGELRSSLQDISTRGAITAEASKGVVIGLRVLDAAFRGVHPGEVFGGTDGPGFVALRERVRGGQSLFEFAGFEAYPRPRRLATIYERGQRRLTDLLENLVVIRQTPQLRLINVVAFASGALGPRGFKRIGVIPTIDTHRELAWSREPHGQYKVVGRADIQDEIHGRVLTALSQLADAGAELLLLPELVSAPELDELIGAELARRAANRLPRPALVLAGTRLVVADGLVRNRALLLDGEGDPAWVQDKLHAYCFTAREQANAGHPLGTEELADRLEAIDVEPRELCVVDLSPTQRVAVLTCEDFIQDDPHREIITDMVATTILVPIMSGRRAGPNAGWIQDGALNYVRHPGATSVIANSGTLMNGTTDGWQYGHVVSTPQIEAEWSAIRDSDQRIVGWLAELPRMV